MSWITITDADLLRVLAGPELEGYRAAALATAQPDPVAETIAEVTQLIRGKVAACERNRLGAGNTIPQELKVAALDILAVRIPMRAAGTNPTNSRKEAMEAAMKLLDDTAACKFAIEAPATVSDQVISSPSPTFSARPKHFTREQQEGL